MTIRVGTSGWSYPSWRPGFYPEGTKPEEFLRFYAARFDTVELNTTGYRLPAEEQFQRWADAVPDGFRFAPKLARDAARPARPSRSSGSRRSATGSGRCGVVIESPRDDGLLTYIARLGRSRRSSSRSTSATSRGRASTGSSP